jgi:putative transposase
LSCFHANEIAGKCEKPEDIVLKLRQVDVLHGQGKSVSQAVRQIGVTIQTDYQWRKKYGGMNSDQLQMLKELGTENQRLKRVVADLSFDKKFLTEAARENI